VSDYLLEIGAEELPYKTCLSLLAQLTGSGDEPGLVHDVLERHRLLGEGVCALPGVFRETSLRVLVSPRRVGIIVTGVEERQTELRQRFRGPKTSVAFDESGAATKAGEGFARGKGLTTEQLVRGEADGTEFVFAEIEEERRQAADVLPDVAREIITGLQIPRGMRWGARPAGASEYFRFSRPLRWLVCKLDGETLGFDFYDLTAGEHSDGHRVLGRPTHIDEVRHYERHLEEQSVIVDHERRRALIIAGLDARAAALGAGGAGADAGGRWFDPGAVLEENIFLVEWPSVHVGRFDERHLRLPREALITAMQSHQRYFPVESAAGELLPAFLYVSNADPKAEPLITHGNQRVLDGRLDDAEFSYDRDLDEGLESMAVRLGDVTFHEKLGSLADKATRLELLAAWVARQRVGGAHAAGDLAAHATRAAALCKGDLVSQMVQEFASLQGVMGGIYARHAGLPAEVSDAIYEHYLPLSATAPVPASPTGACVAVADKIDNIAGAWVAGEKPTGSRDPFGLRRAAMGIVRIALQHELHFVLPELVAEALEGYARQGKVPAAGKGAADAAPATAAARAAAEIEAFIWERLQVLLLDEGLPFALVEAALGARGGIASVPQRAAAARTFAALQDGASFNDVVTAFTRCASLAAKAGPDAPAFPDPALFVVDAERSLYDALRAVAEPVRVAAVAGDLAAALDAAAALRAPVDRFFDDVLVMDDDAGVRDNRLAQLKEITALLGSLGDFARLPVQQS
jgi:glycyl-tRNA synthetase beta chain